MRASEAVQRPTARSGAVWRGVVVGVVAVLVFLAHPLTGIALVLCEIAYFRWLASRTGRPALGARLLTVAGRAAVATVAAVVVGILLLALPIPVP